MGSNATGILAYGYDLGESPAFAELDEYDTPDWWDDGNDFGTAAERRLLDASGFVERYEDGHERYFVREGFARVALGVQLERNSCDEAPTWLLAAHVITGDWGSGTPVDLDALNRDREQYDERLAWAIDVLGIKPTADTPAWLLSADYG